MATELARCPGCGQALAVNCVHHCPHDQWLDDEPHLVNEPPVNDDCPTCDGDGYVECWNDDQTDVVITPCTDCGHAPGELGA